MAVYNVAWFVVVLPLLGALTSFMAETQRRAAQVCIVVSGMTFVLAAIVLVVRLTHASGAPFTGLITFFSFSPPEGNLFATRFEPMFGVLVDSLSAAFAAAVSFVVFLVQAYALGWLRGEAGYRRFFWTSSLFSFAALGFVFSPNSFDSLFMWMAGAAAVYLMALHWSERADAAAPARRALVVLRAGDVALLLGVLYAFIKFGVYASLQPAPAGQDINDPFSFTTIAQASAAVLHHQVSGSGPKTLAVIAALVVFAAGLRAAQLPFQVWLSELAMAPLPVLAMAVTAGAVFPAILLARFYPLLVLVPHARTALALVGAASALGGALIALAQRDLLRIGVFAAVAQLGLALAALGSGGFGPGMFVVFTAIFLNAVLLLAVGNLVRVYRTRDVHETGGAWRRLRVTSAALVGWAAGAAGLALASYYTLTSAFAGAPAGAGRLAGASRDAVTALTLAAAIVIALFAVRLVLLVCAGQVARRRGFQHERVRDADPGLRRWAVVAIVALVASVLVGLPGLNGGGAGRTHTPGLSFTRFVFLGNSPPSLGVDGFALVLVLVALAVGAGLAVLLWSPANRDAPAQLAPRVARLTRALSRALYLDRAAHRGGAPVLLAAGAVARFDDAVMDSVGGALGDVPDGAAALTARLRGSRSALFLAGGITVVAVVALLAVLAATGHFWVRTV